MTMLILGWAGMPRRYYSYLPKYTDLQVIATVGSWILVGGLGMMFGNLIYALVRGKKSEANPWGGATLEWTLPTPPMFENWEGHPPTITHGPYEFNGNGNGNGKAAHGDGAAAKVSRGAGSRKKGK